MSDGEAIVASVGDHNLYLNDLPKLPEGQTSKEDSTVFVNGYIENWLRKTAIVLEAESNTSSELDIKKLVDNYRVSLLINNYQQQYVSEKLDTTVTEADLKMEYEKSGNNFLLEEPVYKVQIAKVSAKKPGLEGFYKAWKEGKAINISKYCNKHAELCTTVDWKTLEQIHTLVPEKKFPRKKIARNKSLQEYDVGFEYFVKIEDKKEKGDKPPLNYISYKLAELVIHRRKKALLEKLESDLYNRAMAANKIKVFKN